MQSDYTFLTDHSYSIRVDYGKLPLKQREIKTKKRRGTSNRSNKTKSTNRTVSIDRSSSDKENNSTINTSGNKRKSPMKKKTTGSRLSSKKQNNKTPSKTSIKSTENSIIKKKKTIIKPLNSHLIDTKDVPLSLSIEERVKLRRTKPLLTSVKPVLNKKPQSNINHPIKKPVKRIHLSKSKKNMIQSKKFFLGSGLDLDNIVLGNRQRRSAQT